MSWNVISAYVLDQVWGFQSANKFRENMIALVSRRSGRHLGGSRTMPNFPTWTLHGQLQGKPPGLGPHDAQDFIDVEIDGTNQVGVTYQARVEVRTAKPACSITPKIRNITDTTDAGVGVACTATNPDYTGTNQRQTIALTIPAGVKKYRLMYSIGALGIGLETWATAEIESYATA